ncbi:MAG: Fic family protein [Clostridia bacterium]|nr:Fic family protein [Clostridia bacterium]
MREFNYDFLKEKRWDKDVLGYIGLIHEYKGKQQLYLKQKPMELSRLVEIAKIQSTESSNAIEGIVTTNQRLKQLMQEKTAPRNRNEQEIMGYRAVLDMIHESFEYMPISANVILQLHKKLYSLFPTSFGGTFKSTSNEIDEIRTDGSVIVRFKPLEPFETPEAVQRLCEEYNRIISSGEVDPLVVIPTFIHDFLCIHPFNDGNGRMSRLLTTLLLYKNGYVVGKYISLEKKIHDNKDDYYDALQSSSENWHEGKNDDTAFTKYMLGVILSAYRDFEERLEIVSEKKSAIDMVKEAFNVKIGKVTKSDIMELCPSLSRSSVEKALRDLISVGFISKHGNGPATFYTLA